jgi:hypothetical protein
VAAALLLGVQLDGWLNRSVTLTAAVALAAMLAPSVPRHLRDGTV